MYFKSLADKKRKWKPEKAGIVMSELGGTSRRHWALQTVLPGPQGKGCGRTGPARIWGWKARLRSRPTLPTPMSKSKMNEDFLCVLENDGQVYMVGVSVQSPGRVPGPVPDSCRTLLTRACWDLGIFTALNLPWESRLFQEDTQETTINKLRSLPSSLP